MIFQLREYEEYLERIRRRREKKEKKQEEAKMTEEEKDPWWLGLVEFFTFGFMLAAAPGITIGIVGALFLHKMLNDT